MNRYRTRYSAKIPPPATTARPAATGPSSANDDGSAAGGSIQGEVDATPESSGKAKAAASTTPDGRRYRYEVRSFDPLAEIHSYARPPDGTRLQRSAPMEPLPLRLEPALALREPMTELGITFGGICYRYRDYRYDQLATAISRARLKQ
jgi:hypothetical protein